MRTEINLQTGEVTTHADAPLPVFTPEQTEEERVRSIKAEGLKRINERFPIIDNIDSIQFFVEFWRSIAVNARQPTIDFQYILDTYTTTKQAIADGTFLNDIVWP